MSGRLATSSVVMLVALCGCDGGDAGAADVNALEDVPWALVSGIDVPGWQAVAPTVTISGGRLSAWAGCNRIAAPVEIQGDTLRIDGDHIQTTLKGCHGVDGDVERAFLTALKRVRTWGIADGRLTLRTDAGDDLLGLEVPTVDGDWIAGMINDGLDFSSTLEDVTITASFKDGTLSGSAGCNTYTATYRSDRGKVTIDPPKATEKQCSEPEGVMEQEHKYLTSIPRSAGYTVEGDGLDLLAADGTFVATFGRK